MITEEEFNALEKRHEELMGLIDIQLKIMNKISNSNIFMFTWDMLFGKKFDTAVKLCNIYLDESRSISHKLYSII